MRIDFLKMQGLGNDFFVFDAPDVAEPRLDENRLRSLADRRTGVGFDQALMLQAPRDKANRVFYRVFNADGTEVEQCGNGARCIAALMYTRAPALGREFSMESVGGLIQARVESDGMVAVNMGVPNFSPQSLPMESSGEALRYSLHLADEDVTIGAVSIGNPHAVLEVPNVDAAPVARIGPMIESHARFAKRTNVGFMQVIDRGHIRLRVFERGVGETRACGTGACGAVAVGRRQGLLDDKVRVDLSGGTARVAWPAAGEPIWLTGPATTVFTGMIEF
jgi:diaminopimelate epimerase